MKNRYKVIDEGSTVFFYLILILKTSILKHKTKKFIQTVARFTILLELLYVVVQPWHLLELKPGLFERT